MDLVVGRCYLVSLLEPFKDINDISPIKVPRLIDGWRMAPATTALKRVKNQRIHPAIVIRYNHATKNAVILLGSAQPYRAHRFIPCAGTQRLDFQTLEILRPDPLAAFSVRQGHFNFSHAIHVRVLQPHEYDMPAFKIFPGLRFFRQFRDEEVQLKIAFDDTELTLLKELHSAYWMGRRYSKDGELLLPPSSPTSPSAQPPGGSSSNAQPPGGSSLNAQPPSGPAPNAQHLSGATSSSQQASIDPILGPSGLKFSTRVANLLEKEDARGLQLELLDEDEDISSISPPFLGFFQTFTHSLFQELDEDPMPANDGATMLEQMEFENQIGKLTVEL